MKTCKESVVGLVAALEAFVQEQKDYPEAQSAVAASLARKIRVALGAALGAAAGTVVIRLASGASEGMHEVQPSAHDLVFVEFLEAYCRVANDMLDASGLDTKLLLGIDMLCELSLNLP